MKAEFFRLAVSGPLALAAACLLTFSVSVPAAAADLNYRKAERYPPKVRYHRHYREYEYRDVYYCRTGWWRVRAPGIEGMHGIRRPAWLARCH
jgi:hypothetical protein